jgi:hypothetical protein
MSVHHHSMESWHVSVQNPSVFQPLQLVNELLQQLHQGFHESCTWGKHGQQIAEGPALELLPHQRQKVMNWNGYEALPVHAM